MFSDVLPTGGTTPHLTRRLAAAATAAAVAVIGVAGCGVLDPPPEPLVIGVDVAEAGAAAGVDEVYRQALELRVGQLNDQRAVGGLPPIELRVRDNRSDPAVTGDNAAKWAADTQVAAVITGSCAACAIEAADLIDELEIPVVALAAGEQFAGPEGGRWLFQLAPEAAGVSDVLARHIADDGAVRVGLLASDDSQGQDAARELAGALGAQQAELTISESVPATGDDDAVLAQAAAAVVDLPAPEPTVEQPFPAAPEPPDAVVLWVSPAVALQAATAVRETGFDGPMWLAPTAAGELTLTGAEAEALTGARLLTADTLVADEVLATMPHRAQRRVWFQSYVSEHGAYHAAAGYAADALDVIVAAADRAGEDPALRSTVRGLVETTQHLGMAGQIRYSPGSHTSPDPTSLTVLTFTGERWRPAT